MRAVNPNAQPEVQRVLDYLEENRGNRLILGQHTQTMEQPELEHIRRITGKLPALCGFELLGYSPNIRPEDSGEECMTEVVNARGTLRKAWEWARLGGLITFTWHWFSPLGGRDKSFFSENTDFSASRAAQSGTPENAAFLNDLDYMAGLLRPFSDEHIPILWRPFHEAEGSWFWWGREGAEPCKKLYRSCQGIRRNQRQYFHGKTRGSRGDRHYSGRSRAHRTPCTLELVHDLVWQFHDFRKFHIV